MKLKNNALQELYDTIVNGTFVCSVYARSPIDTAFGECDKKLSESITFATIKDLQDRNDILERSNKHLLEANMESISKTRKLEKEIDYLKKDKKQLEEALEDANTTLEKANVDRTNLQEACDKLSGENRRLNARIECLREEVNWYRKHYRENLNKVLNTARDDGYESGQKDLWDMLQEVSDYYYFGGDDEFDTDDCEMISMTDIIDNLNVNQFLEAYKNWHKEQKQTWECTLEGNIKINGDLLGKVCGIKIDDD